jgi:hypothetical protein
MKKRNTPNAVMFSFLLIFFLWSLFCGSSLWIPASRLQNAYLKSILLPVSDTIASVGDYLGTTDFYLKWKNLFLDKTGLSEHPSWDTRFYNQRNKIETDTKENDEKKLDITSPEEKVELKEVVAETVIAEIKIEEPITEPVVYNTANPFKLYIFGDSQISSFGGGFKRLIGDTVIIQETHLGIISSGFIRDEYYTWGAKLKDECTKNTYDAAIFMLGMNDNIDITDADGNPIRRRTQEWNDMYIRRCTELIDIMLSLFPKIYWLGMPMPKSKTYDENLKIIDGLHDKIAANYDSEKLVRVSVRDIFPGSGQAYAESVIMENGKTLKVMGTDGIHLTVGGGQYIMKKVLDRILTDFTFTETFPITMPE